MSNTIIRTNVLAMNAHRNLGSVGRQQATSSQRLSSGFRINSASDDAAGLGISEKMRAQIRGLGQASRNAQDAISLVQTAEGGLSTINEMLLRMRELVVQASNDTNVHNTESLNQSDRARIQTEIGHLISEIDATAGRVEFNTRSLLDGSSSDLHMQIGANSGQSLSFSIENMNASSLGVDNINVEEASGSTINTQLDTIDAALATATNQRSNLGAIQNRLEFTIENLDIAAENLSAAESRIRDTDMAAEMMRLTQSNVLQQAATAMLAQANQAPQSVLQLLG